MSNQDWIARWQDNRIAFHESDVNRYLEKYFSMFELPHGSRVFMPLCGKANDIAWFAAKGYEVIGIELSEIAIKAFFDEHVMSFQRFESADFVLYKSKQITLIQGDFFKLEAEHIGDCDFIYDRAALIALNPELRSRYVQHIRNLTPLSPPQLLISLDYPQQQMQGPPFSVSGQEIRDHYSDSYNINVLETADILNERATWKERGLKSLEETVYHLEKR